MCRLKDSFPRRLLLQRVGDVRLHQVLAIDDQLAPLRQVDDRIRPLSPVLSIGAVLENEVNLGSESRILQSILQRHLAPTAPNHRLAQRAGERLARTSKSR